VRPAEQLLLACLVCLLPASALADNLPEMGWLGISIAEVGEELADRLASAFGPAAGNGVQVVEVLKNGPAESARLARGDVIVQVDTQPIWDVRQLQRLIRSRLIGGRLSLTVLRDTARLTLPVVVGPMPLPARAQLAGERFGFSVRELSDETVGRPPAAARIVIAFVEADSPAARADLRPLDAILTLNDQPVRDLEGFAQALARSQRAARLLLERRGAPAPIAATVELPG
jgi:S1-C subfamily serine protease